MRWRTRRAQRAALIARFCRRYGIDGFLPNGVWTYLGKSLGITPLAAATSCGAPYEIVGAVKWGRLVARRKSQ